jgi:hypothetical protein
LDKYPAVLIVPKVGRESLRGMKLIHSWKPLTLEEVISLPNPLMYTDHFLHMTVSAHDGQHSSFTNWEIRNMIDWETVFFASSREDHLQEVHAES